MSTSGRVSWSRPRQLEEAAEGVGQAHLLRGAAVRGEESWVGDDRGHAAGARGGDVEAVQAVEELHPPRRFVGARGRHRVDHDRRLLSLELVDRAHPGAGRQRRPQDRDVRVVGGHDEDVLERQRLPKGADTQQVLSTVVRTVRQRRLDLPMLTAEMLRARQPAIPEAFGLPPPPA